MTGVTTIQIPPATRDRLKKFGLKGQTYQEILDRLMDRVEYEEFMEEQYRIGRFRVIYAVIGKEVQVSDLFEHGAGYEV